MKSETVIYIGPQDNNLGLSYGQTGQTVVSRAFFPRVKMDGGKEVSLTTKFVFSNSLYLYPNPAQYIINTNDSK